MALLINKGLIDSANMGILYKSGISIGNLSSNKVPILVSKMVNSDINPVSDGCKLHNKFLYKRRDLHNRQ